MVKKYQLLKEQISYSISESGLDIGAAYFKRCYEQLRTFILCTNQQRMPRRSPK